jgi:hypothetical protein
MKKNLLIFLSTLFLVAFVSSCKTSTSDSSTASEEETTEETAAPEDEWMVLFDGTSTEGWRGYNKTEFPKGWIIEDGAIKCNGSGRGEAGAEDGGDIIYDKQFSNFHLKLEWKISEGGNSGIFYLGQEIEGQPVYVTAPEMQVLDNEKHIDSDMGKDGNRKAGSLYDLIPANPQNAKPAGEWNQVEIIVYNGTVVHKQNGETVVEYHLWTDKWNELVAGSKFPGLNEDWANVAKEGYIALQDHGHDVWFRNISIKEL